MKKLLFIIVMALFMPCANIWAADGDTFTATTVEGVEMNFEILSEDGKTCSVARDAISRSHNGSVTIPEFVNGYRVTAIGTYAFQMCYFSSVSIPNSITTINYGAFYYCSNLKNVVIPNE